MSILPSFGDSEIVCIDPAAAAEISGQAVPDYRAAASAIAPNKTIFFVGIGGISMSGLAEYASLSGARCCGSDPAKNARTEYLSNIGVTVFHGHDASNIDSTRPDLVVYSSAVFDDNPERHRARELGIPCVSRPVFLGAVNRLYSRVINISGTNGKTTTTAMCALILMEAGLDPAVHLGAELREFRSTIRVSESRKHHLLLSEACEFRRGFYHYTGTAAAILNIVHDHIDCYRTFDEMIEAFARFVALQPEGSFLVLPADDPAVPRMLRDLDDIRPGHIDRLNVVWVGRKRSAIPCGATPASAANRDHQGNARTIPCGAKASYTYEITGCDEHGYHTFDLYKNDVKYTTVQLSVIGEFNVQNAVAAAALADLCGATPQGITNALGKFRGAEDRFTHTGTYNGADVYIDYAHHPSAVRVTVAAARLLPAKRLWICFQPLTHSRVRGFFDDFVEVLLDVQPVMISEIYDNREKDSSISSRDLCDRINECGGKAEYYETNQELKAHLRTILEPGDVLLIMSPDPFRMDE